MAAPLELVQRIPLFAELKEKELKQVAGSFKERSFSAGDVIVEEGQESFGFLYVIESGEADVTVKGEHRTTLTTGDYFGEVALVEGQRTATVTAKTPLRAYGMTPWDFKPLVEAHPSIAWKMIETLVKRLRATQGDP